jgi:hypothetical protein
VVRTRGERGGAVATPGWSILADVAEIGINWFDLVLAGNETARRNLTENPCGSFKSGMWSMEAKYLDSLVRTVH